jgi:hypothetical protein
MAVATKTRWSLEGDYLQACNCDYGCPCEFEAPPTKGFCEGVGVWRITKGAYGTVDLAGLAFGFAAYWPKAIHEGNGTVQLVFDEKAKPEQRDALMQIASGQAGGMPFELIVQTFSKVMEPAYVKAEFELNGSTAKARMGDFITVSTEAIKNPVTKQPESLRVAHETGFLFKEAAVVAGTCSTKGAGLNFSHPDKAGFIAKFKYGN